MAVRPSWFNLLLRPFGSVLRSALFTTLNADRIERPADHVVPNAGQVLHAAAANQHQGVFLQVVPHARNVGRHLDAVGQANARHFAQRGVRFLRRLGEDAHADAALLRTDLQRGTFRLRDDLLASLTNELANRRHKRSRVISSRTRQPRSGVRTSSKIIPTPYNTNTRLSASQPARRFRPEDAARAASGA